MEERHSAGAVTGEGKHCQRSSAEAGKVLGRNITFTSLSSHVPVSCWCLPRAKTHPEDNQQVSEVPSPVHRMNRERYKVNLERVEWGNREQISIYLEVTAFA